MAATAISKAPCLSHWCLCPISFSAIGNPYANEHGVFGDNQFHSCTGNSDATKYAVGNPYGDEHGVFGDNQFRYALLSLAACEAPLQLQIGGYRCGVRVRVGGRPSLAQSCCLPLLTSLSSVLLSYIWCMIAGAKGRIAMHVVNPLLKMPLLLDVLTLISRKARAVQVVLGRHGEPPGFAYGDRCVFVSNDWHAALVPSYLAAKYRRHGVYQARQQLTGVATRLNGRA